MAEKITADQLKSQKSDFVIIDVRESDELEGGIIENSVHMPLGLSIRNAKKKQIEVGSSTVKAIGKKTTARGDEYWWQSKRGLKNSFTGKGANERFRYSLRNVANQPNAEKLVKQLGEEESGYH